MPRKRRLRRQHDDKFFVIIQHIRLLLYQLAKRAITHFLPPVRKSAISSSAPLEIGFWFVVGGFSLLCGLSPFCGLSLAVGSLSFVVGSLSAAGFSGTGSSF